ncbi:MAG TPA: hypothetical protein VGA09_00280, partial [Candidatus Binatia bacterium]
DIRMIAALNAQTVCTMAAKIIIHLIAVNRLGQTQTDGPLADSFRAEEEISVVQPSIRQGNAQCF